MAVEILGLDRLRAKIARVVTEAEESADAALGVGAQMVAERAAERAPRVTGELADSMDYEREEPGVWLAGTNLWRAHFTEFGTIKSHAQPFLFPAFEELRLRIVTQVFAARVRGAIRGVAKG